MSVASKPEGAVRAVTQASTARRLLTLAAIACAFAAGSAVGAGVMCKLSHDQRAQMFRNPDKARDEFAEQLRTRLALTPEQDEQITAIVVERHNEFEAFRHRVHPEIAAIFDGMEREIKEQLRPDQQDTFKQIIEERQRMFPPPPAPRGKKKS